MLDPTYRMYLKDSEDRYISLEALRKMLIGGEEFYINENASYNGNELDKEYHRNYMIKNTFRFSRGIFYDNGSDDRVKRRVELIPVNYPTEKFDDSAKADFVYNDEEFWKM